MCYRSPHRRERIVLRKAPTASQYGCRHRFHTMLDTELDSLSECPGHDVHLLAIVENVMMVKDGRKQVQAPGSVPLPGERHCSTKRNWVAQSPGDVGPVLRPTLGILSRNVALKSRLSPIDGKQKRFSWQIEDVALRDFKV